MAAEKKAASKAAAASARRATRAADAALTPLPVRDTLTYADIYALVRAVVHQHEGLAFLRSAEHEEFRERYSETVAVRILYSVGRSKLGVTRRRFVASDFTDSVFALASGGAEAVNQCVKYFSYEHFYVVYVKFWELDTDHDLWVNGAELEQYGGNTWSSAIVRRLLCSQPRFEPARVGSQLHYRDFAWLMLAEEDKSMPAAIDFWFHCLDLDGDGVLSRYELQRFYDDQHARMVSVDAEDATDLRDAMCIIFDIVKPAARKHYATAGSQNVITLADLRACPHVTYVFDLLFSLRAMMEDEALSYDRSRMAIPPAQARPPAPGAKWVAFAKEAYQALAADEDDDSDYDDDESCSSGTESSDDDDDDDDAPRSVSYVG